MTADEDYEALKAEIKKLDILPILSQELNKTRVHTSLVKKIINMMKHLDQPLLDQLVDSLIDNLEILAPVIPNVLIMCNDVFDKIADDKKVKIINTLLRLLKEKSYLLEIKLNLYYAIRLLAKINHEETRRQLVDIYNNNGSSMIKRDIILVFAKWGIQHQISHIKNNFGALSIAEKRGFIIASYYINDEGSHWRGKNKERFSELDIIYRDWIAAKNIKAWGLPI
jgi:hypothetical protein